MQMERRFKGYHVQTRYAMKVWILELCIFNITKLNLSKIWILARNFKEKSNSIFYLVQKIKLIYTDSIGMNKIQRRGKRPKKL